ncbi:MAG: peptidase T [Lachnospiraceae bacterium]|nr:peptidase T [Lachnospiraceae bacterium]
MIDVCERFLKYVSFDTQSDDDSESCPSTEKQKILGAFLRDELMSIGAADAYMDENGYVYGTIPASSGAETAPVLAFLSHMDTSPAASGRDVHPVISHEDRPEGTLDIIHTDGTTLLGADDKAGIAEIMTMADRLLHDPDLPHPELRIIFTPDEEIGRGVDRIDMSRVNAAYAFTVDGGEVGELSYECFNAAGAKVTVRGDSYHPGDSYGKMKNAILIAQEFNTMLPPEEIPAKTRGREGFYHLDAIRGDVSFCEMNYIIRDHDKTRFEERKEKMREAARAMNDKYGGVCVELTDSYANMIGDILPEHAFLLDAVRSVYNEMGITPDESPIRGGTDGARLSSMGLPCPNLGTGGHDFHGPHEWISVQSMEKAVEVLVRVAAKLAEGPKGKDSGSRP